MSGAYIFKPNKETKNHSIPYSKITKETTYSGNIVTILKLEGEYITTLIKIYK